VERKFRIHQALSKSVRALTKYRRTQKLV